MHYVHMQAHQNSLLLFSQLRWYYIK